MISHCHLKHEAVEFTTVECPVCPIVEALAEAKQRIADLESQLAAAADADPTARE